MTINSAIPYWTPTPPVDTERRLRECLSVLANRRQRAVLRVLTESGRSLSTDELVTRLVADDETPIATGEVPIADARPGDDARLDNAAVRISLTHVDLPQLAATGFVTTSREASTVRLSEHPLLDDPHVGRLLAREELWDDRIAVLAVSRHRRIRAVLAASPGPLPRERLAAMLCAHESATEVPLQRHSPTAETTTPTVPPAAVAAMVAALHHVHLPTLAEAGLVVYDPETGTVDARSSPTPEEWQPPVSPAAAGQYPVDSTASGVVVRLVVAPDGGVADAYAYSVGESAIGTVPIPARAPTATEPSLTTDPSSTTGTATATRTAAPSSRHREQWLVDCWLRQHTGF